MARTAFDAGVRTTSLVTMASAVIVLPTRPPMAHPSRRLEAAEPAAPSGRRLFGTRLTPAAAGMPSSALRLCSSQPHRQLWPPALLLRARPIGRSSGLLFPKAAAAALGSSARSMAALYLSALSPHEREGIGKFHEKLFWHLSTNALDRWNHFNRSFSESAHPSVCMIPAWRLLPSGIRTCIPAAWLYFEVDAFNELSRGGATYRGEVATFAYRMRMQCGVSCTPRPAAVLPAAY
jgi:hypothetical protein